MHRIIVAAAVVFALIAMRYSDEPKSVVVAIALIAILVASLIVGEER